MVNDRRWNRALRFRERLGVARGRQAGNGTVVGSAAARRQIEQWRLLVASTDSPLGAPSQLHGCTEEEFVGVLGAAWDAIPVPAPAWSQAIERAFLDETVDGTEFERCSSTKPGTVFLAGLTKPIDLALRRVGRAARRLHQRNAAPYDPSNVAQLLFDASADTLAGILLPTAVLELHAARRAGDLAGAEAHARFASFIKRLREPSASFALLHDYPVLARLVITWLDDWATAAEELLERLSTDWDAIAATFAGVADDEMLVGVEIAGDRHRRGRAVVVLEFSSSLKLVYKPRSVSNELHFQSLLQWLNEHTDLPPYRCLAMLNRETHGWVEHVSVSSCASPNGVKRFYERQGGYLALLQTLSAVDFHAENIIAAGEHPVLVDLEGLFHQTGLWTPAGLHDAERKAIDLTAESVLRVGLLPQRLWGDAETPGVDISGFGASPGQPYPVRVARWEEPETDEMRQVMATVETGDGFNSLPVFEGCFALPQQHVEEIVAGFAKAYAALLAHRAELLQPAGAIGAFADDETRVLYRPTTSYGIVLRSSFHPQALLDGLDHDRRLDRLFATTPGWKRADELIEAERHDLWHCDVPIFTTRPNTRHVWDSRGRRIDGALEETGMSLVARRLATFGDADLARQTSLIRVAIATSSLNSAHALDYPTYAVSGPVGAADRGELLEAACSIGNRLDELAVRGEDGGATWIGVTSDHGSAWSIAPVGPSLYDGLAGIALFLATLGGLSGEGRHTELARAAVSVMRGQVERAGTGVSIGAFSGIAGQLYVLTHLGAMWNEPALLDEAKHLASIVSEAIEQDSALDVVSGAAGCIVPLLNLHQVSPTDSVLATAEACGEHLLDHAQQGDEGLTWRPAGLTSLPLAGFAHGAAGYTWALLRLAATTEDRRFRDAAIEGIRYERTLFSPESGNWRDLRDDLEVMRLGVEAGAGYFMAYWCHGAAGIGLARLRSGLEEDADVKSEIAVAVCTTLASGFGLNHSLCHGDLGNADFLIQAAAKLKDTELRRKADQIGARVLASARTDGWITGYPLGLEAPGLMTGLAGIGYGLLRLVDEQNVPSVLTLDPPASQERASRPSKSA